MFPDSDDRNPMRAVRFHRPPVPQRRVRVHGLDHQGLVRGALHEMGLPIGEERHGLSALSGSMYPYQEEEGEGDWSDLECDSPTYGSPCDADFESVLQERGLQLCYERGYPCIRPVEGHRQESSSEVSKSEAADVPCERSLSLAETASENGEEGSGLLSSSRVLCTWVGRVGQSQGMR